MSSRFFFQSASPVASFFAYSAGAKVQTIGLRCASTVAFFCHSRRPSTDLALLSLDQDGSTSFVVNSNRIARLAVRIVHYGHCLDILHIYQEP